MCRGREGGREGEKEGGREAMGVVPRMVVSDVDRLYKEESKTVKLEREKKKNSIESMVNSNI